MCKSTNGLLTDIAKKGNITVNMCMRTIDIQMDGKLYRYDPTAKEREMIKAYSKDGRRLNLTSSEIGILTPLFKILNRTMAPKIM